MTSTFISYRREDSAGWSGRLNGELSKTFGKNNVFFDLQLEPGILYDQAIDQWLDIADVMLVMIGPHWLTIKNAEGQRRLDDPADLTRIEVSKALTRNMSARNIRVIPVLVGGAAMPSAQELPTDLHELERRQAHELSDKRWDYDRDQLVAAIKRVSVRGKGRAQSLVGVWLRRLVSVLVVAMVGGLTSLWYEQPLKEGIYWFANVRGTVLTAAQEGALKPQETFKECVKCPQMVVMPAGSFLMGSPAGQGEKDERPQHLVTIAKPFAVGKFELTFEEWDACAREGDCYSDNEDNGWGRGRQPMINVSWDYGQRYVAWLSRITGQSYRLLTEAEWEYAARAGSDKIYSWGDEIGKDNANCNGCGSQWNKRTAPVGSFAPNAFGLHDMHGNVSEWVQDCYRGDYDGAPGDGSALITSDCSLRVIRGGSWDSDPPRLRAASRSRFTPVNRLVFLGLRVGRTLKP